MLPGHDPQDRLDQNAYDGITVEEGLDRFAGAREESFRFLQTLSPEERARRGVHEEYGEMSLEMQVQKCVAHDLLHVADILERTRSSR